MALNPACGCGCLLCKTGIHCPMCWMSGGNPRESALHALDFNEGARMRVIVGLVLVVVCAGCAAKTCVTRGRGNDGAGGPNLFLGERLCNGLTSRCCNPSNAIHCNCDRLCPCWESASHAGAR